MNAFPFLYIKQLSNSNLYLNTDKTCTLISPWQDTSSMVMGNERSRKNHLTFKNAHESKCCTCDWKPESTAHGCLNEHI